MHKYIKYSFFLIPLLYFLAAFILKSAQGPYYLSFYDPGYVYMISSLNLAQGFGVGHIDHPGTTVQVIGSVIVKIYYLLSGKSTDIAADVLSRPEDYMFVINTALIFINSMVLFFLGLFIYKTSNNIYLSLLLQISPFTSMEIFYGSIIVSPDNFLITVTLLFICALYYYWYKTDEKSTSSYKFIFVFGIICGMGLATKLNFIPLILIPFILFRGFKYKSAFILFTMISFFIFISPILADIDILAQWMERLIINSGKHGRGESNVVNSNLLIPNLKMIFTKDLIFTVSYITLVITFIISLIKHFKQSSPRENYFNKINKILFSLLMAITFQIFIVAKHYAQYYLIPSMLLSVTIFVISVYIIFPYLRNVFKSLKPEYCLAIVFVLISIWSLSRIYSSYNEAVVFEDESLKSLKFIEDNYPGNIVISSFGSTGKETALAFSVRYAAKKVRDYEKIISEMNKSQIFYNPYENNFYKSSDKDKLKNDLLNSSNKKLLLQIHYRTPEEFISKLNEICGVSNSSYKEVFSNGNSERIYEVTIK